MKILDCTLRDGGYYNNWNFPEKVVLSYFTAMESLPIEYVEIGYRSLLDGDFGEYFNCSEGTMKRAKKMMPSKKLAIMLNEKNIDISRLEKLLLPCKSYVSLVRLAVSPDRISIGAKLAKAVKSFGFEVAFNVMYLSKFVADEDVLESFSSLENFIDYLYLVDSYGGAFPRQVKSIIQKAKQKTSIPIGFHGHNNLDLAFINSVTAIDEGVKIIDSTIMGMGRGAGNLRTELFLTYLAVQKNVEIDFDLLDSTLEHFKILHKKYGWGTNLAYMISGLNSLPQQNALERISSK